MIGLAVLGAAIGLLRHDAYMAQQYDLQHYIGQKVAWQGIITDDPSGGNAKYTSFKLGELRDAEGRHIPGEITIFSYPVRVQRGFLMAVSGTLKPGYGTAAAELGYPKLTVIAADQSWLELRRQSFFAGMKTALPEPLASFGLGLLVGVRALIPKDLQTQLTLVGLSHLVAVSGYNLTILIVAAQRLLERLGRGIALMSSLWLIFGFLVVAGASASIVRASVVAVLALFANYYGRRFEAVALILVAGAVTALLNPGYLTDLGWLLSFLAFFGIMVLAPAVEARLGNPKPILVKLFIESFAAQIMTVPLILFIFGQFSIVSPLSNLLVLPLVPLAMLVSFAAGLAGMFIPAFCGWFAWPAQLVLGFILALVDWLARMPWASRPLSIDAQTMVGMYVLILAGLIAMTRRNKRAGAIVLNDHLLEPVRSAITTV